MPDLAVMTAQAQRFVDPGAGCWSGPFGSHPTFDDWRSMTGRFHS